MQDHESLHHIVDDRAAQVEKLSAELRELPPQPHVTLEQLEALAQGNPELMELFEEMAEYFFRYYEDVAAYQETIAQGITDENRLAFQEQDKARTRLHNTMIDSVRIFARALQKAGKDISWIANLEKSGRTAYANFALLIAHNEAVKLLNRRKESDVSP